jgi:hypothetical protein
MKAHQFDVRFSEKSFSGTGMRGREDEKRPQNEAYPLMDPPEMPLCSATAIPQAQKVKHVK